MNRFTFCNCPAGFSAAPERHAPDCPGRWGVGKAPMPASATAPKSSVSASDELDAVLHWRNKHTQAVREREALQLRLTTADQRIDELEGKLADLVSAVRSINRSPHYMVKVIGDDQPQYRQRKEWIDWVLELCDAALSATAEPAPICCGSCPGGCTIQAACAEPAKAADASMIGIVPMPPMEYDEP